MHNAVLMFFQQWAQTFYQLSKYDVSTLDKVENPTSDFVSFSTSDQRYFNVDLQRWNNFDPTLKCWLGMMHLVFVSNITSIHGRIVVWCIHVLYMLLEIWRKLISFVKSELFIQLRFHVHCLILLKMTIIEHYIHVSTLLPGKILTNSPKCICYGVHFNENFGFNLATLIKMVSTTDET